MLMATEADHRRRPAGKQRNNTAHVLHNNKGMRCIHGWTSTVHPRLALLDSGCGVALLNSGCGVALLDSSFGVALLDMVLGPCSGTTPATARSADLQRPVVMRRTFEAVLSRLGSRSTLYVWSISAKFFLLLSFMIRINKNAKNMNAYEKSRTRGVDVRFV